MRRACKMAEDVTGKCDPRWCRVCKWNRDAAETEGRETRDETELLLREEDVAALLWMGFLQVALLCLKACGVPWPWYMILLPLEIVSMFVVTVAAVVKALRAVRKRGVRE